MKQIILIAIVGLMFSCTSKTDFSKGKQQLENMGYNTVINTGFNAFCCDEKDTFSTGFIATDKEGRKVKGCFCSSITKGVTIRFE